MNSRMMMSLLGVVLLFGILIILLPDFSEIPEERMTSASMMMCTGKIRTAIEKDIINGQTIKTSHEVKCPKLISHLKVSESGKVEVVNPTYNIRLAFTPEMRSGKVKWSCQGSPLAFVPAKCQQDSSKGKQH